MRHPEIAHNIRAASDYSRTLRAPRYREMYPQHAPQDPTRLGRGREVYRAHCFGCHGDRDESGVGWSDGPRTHEVTPLAVIGTDPERLVFRHYGSVPERLFRLFDGKHPFHFARDEIWPQRGEEENVDVRGYLNAPLDGLYLRAPYLHNASVLTLAELHQSEAEAGDILPGHNLYDPIDAGFRLARQGGRQTYFRFDRRYVEIRIAATTIRGRTAIRNATSPISKPCSTTSKRYDQSAKNPDRPADVTLAQFTSHS